MHTLTLPDPTKSTSINVLLEYHNRDKVIFIHINGAMSVGGNDVEQNAIVCKWANIDK